MKRKERKNHTKIGILGGTFDPPHKGHIYISLITLKKLKLNKILWIVTKKNPLKKKPYLSAQVRIKLSKKITKNEKKIFVKFFDTKIGSVNTFDLLNHIKKKQKGTELYFLIGADNLVKFHKWKNWKQIPKLAKIVVFPRKNHSYNSIATNYLNKKDLIYIKTKKINISSSLIRKFW